MDLSKHFIKSNTTSFLKERNDTLSVFVKERESLEKRISEQIQTEEQMLFSMEVDGFWFFETEQDRIAFQNDTYVNKPRMLKKIVVYYNEINNSSLYPYGSISMVFESWCDEKGYSTSNPYVHITEDFIDNNLQYGTETRNKWFFLKKEEYETVKEIITELKKYLYPKKDK